MLHSYNELFVSSATKIFGTLIEYIIVIKKNDINEFIKLFLSTSICKEMEKGNPNYVYGRSGIELYQDIIYEITGKYPIIKYEDLNLCKEYWAGYIVSYYQWFTRRTFEEIFDAIKISDIIELYNPYHEADISVIFDILDQYLIKNDNSTRLKRMRIKVGYTQKELSNISKIGLRSIQMYEERNKNINSASVTTVIQLARSLFCNVEDIIEPNFCNNITIDDFGFE